MIRVLLVVTCEVPDPQGITAALESLNPPSIPYFAGKVRVISDPAVAASIENWLDE